LPSANLNKFAAKLGAALHRRHYRALQRAISTLPLSDCARLLNALDSGKPIWAGLYAPEGVYSGEGCPVYIASRIGEAVVSPHKIFADAWDDFCIGSRKNPRRATQGEILVLRMLLEARVFPARERHIMPPLMRLLRRRQQQPVQAAELAGAGVRIDRAPRQLQETVAISSS